MKYRKKPVVIAVTGLFYRSGFTGFMVADDKGYNIQTLEGVMHASTGDWIIKGIRGDFYTCKPEIFDESYEVVNP